MKTKFREAFFSHSCISQYCQYWIYAKIRVQHGVFPIGILRFWTTLLKCSLNVSAISVSELRISPFSIRFIISLTVISSEKSGLTDFQNFLLSVISFGSKFEKCCFWLYAKRLHINCTVFCKHFGKHHFYLWENHYVILIFSL